MWCTTNEIFEVFCSYGLQRGLQHGVAPVCFLFSRVVFFVWCLSLEVQSKEACGWYMAAGSRGGWLTSSRQVAEQVDKDFGVGPRTHIASDERSRN